MEESGGKFPPLLDHSVDDNKKERLKRENEGKEKRKRKKRENERKEKMKNEKEMRRRTN